MVKKRTVKKRLIRRKAVKKDDKKEVSDVSRMSRLEYEQSMMDPRFRAAMIGFNNNPANPIHQVNNQLREQETKNNMLTRQITLQAQLSEDKKRESQLKNELSNAKQQHKDEMTKLQYEMKIQKLQDQNESEKIKFTNELEKQKQEMEMTNLRNMNEKLKRAMEAEQAKRKQDEEKLNLDHEFKMKQQEQQHQQKAFPIQHAINEMNNNLKENKFQFEADEKLNNLMTEKKIVEQKVHPKTKAKHDKEVQQLKMKEGKYKKQLELVEDTARAKEHEDKMRQDVLTKAMILNKNIKPEDINDTEKFQQMMLLSKVESQDKLTKLQQQQKVANEAMEAQKQVDEFESEAIHDNLEFFTRHSAMNDYAEKVLGYKTTAEKFQNVDKIIHSFYEDANKSADIIKRIPIQRSNVLMPVSKAEEMLSNFAEAYEAATGLKIQDERERITQEQEQLRISQANALGLANHAEWLYNNAIPEVKQKFNEMYPSHNINDWNDNDDSSDLDQPYEEE